MSERPPESGGIALTDSEKSALMNAAHDADRMNCACQPVWDAAESILAARLARVWAILDAWEAWDGSLGPDGRTHDDAPSPRDRERLRAALTTSSGEPS